MAADDERRDGAATAEARRLATMRLGGVEQVKERVRTGRHGAWLDEAWRGVRYALRTCAHNPGFSLAVVVTLALGIGANSAVRDRRRRPAAPAAVPRPEIAPNQKRHCPVHGFARRRRPAAALGVR